MPRFLRYQDKGSQSRSKQRLSTKRVLKELQGEQARKKLARLSFQRADSKLRNF